MFKICHENAISKWPRSMTKYCFSRVLVVIKGSNWFQNVLFEAAE